MQRQNVTLAVPKEILYEAKPLADDAYTSASQRHLSTLEHASNLGTEGAIIWSCEDLHDR